MRIRKEETVAILVDYQEKLVPIMQKSEELIQHASILVAGLKALEVPMYVTQQYTRGLGQTIAPIWNAMGVSEQAESSQEPPYIEKITFSAFDEIAHCVNGKKYVIVCGIEAHICVLQTVIDLAEAGYVPILVADCISSRKERDLEYALERAKQEGAIVTTYEALLFELLKVAGSEQSKKIQKLIK